MCERDGGDRSKRNNYVNMFVQARWSFIFLEDGVRVVMSQRSERMSMINSFQFRRDFCATVHNPPFLILHLFFTFVRFLIPTSASNTLLLTFNLTFSLSISDSI